MVLSGDERTLGWGCSKCKGEGFEDGDKLREIRNCDSSQNANIAWDWMPSLRRCPWSQIDEEAWMYLSWWAEWVQFKVLPYGGTDLLEQPAYVIEAFSFFQEIKADIEKKKARKQQQEIERARKNATRGRGR